MPTQLEDQVACAHIPGQSVASFVVENSGFVRRFGFILVTVLDSDSDLARRPSWLELDAQAIGRGLCAQAESFLRWASRRESLVGFDEIWIFGRGPLTGPPSAGNLVCPADVGAEISDSMVKWFLESECIVGLGDGDGLNIIARNDGTLGQLRLQ